MRITRRRLLKTTGAAGAVALATSAKAQTLRRPGAAAGSAAAPGAIRELDADGDLGIEDGAGRITLPI